MVDLIHSLTADLGTEPGRARLIAGRLLGWLEHAIRASFGQPMAEAFSRRLPESAPWRSAALAAVPPRDGEDQSALGVDAALMEILGSTGLDPVQAGLTVPPLNAYLKSRLPPDLFSVTLRVAPFLAMAAPERHPRPLPLEDATMFYPE
jgi:hypothetical protein